MSDTSPVAFRSVSVHAGGHCTGSEDFQRFLSANRAALAAAGVAVDGPDEAVAGPQARRRIVSDQNLAGTMAMVLGGLFYPTARARAAALRAALGQPVERLVMVVQPYEVLFGAVWQRFALDRPMEPFAQYAKELAGIEAGWVETVEALREGLEAREVIVLTAREHPQALLSHLAPEVSLRDPVMPAPAPTVTPSAVAMIQRHYAQGGRFAPGQRERILAFHARQPQDPMPRVLDFLALADLRGRYVADLAMLSRTPGVHVVGNFIPAMAAE